MGRKYRIDTEALEKALQASARWSHFSKAALGRMMGYSDGGFGNAILRGSMTEEMVDKVSKRLNIPCETFVREEIQPEYTPKQRVATLVIDPVKLNALLPQDKSRVEIAHECGFDSTTLNKVLRTGFASGTFIDALCKLYSLNADDFVVKADNGKVPTQMPAMVDLDVLYGIIFKAALAALKEVFDNGDSEAR